MTREPSASAAAPTVHREGMRDGETQDTGPNQDAYGGNDFSKPRLFYLPIYRKVRNSLA